MRELTASKLVAIRSDTGSHNRLDLIQSLVLPHYVCNRYVTITVIDINGPKKGEFKTFLFSSSFYVVFFVFFLQNNHLHRLLIGHLKI